MGPPSGDSAPGDPVGPAAAASAVAATTFDSSFSIGIEEELLLVDRATGDLLPAAELVLARVGGDRTRVDGELYAAQLEVRSGRCDDAAQALAALRDARSRVARAGGAVIGSGLHPTAPFGVADIAAGPRYRRVSEIFGGLMARTPEAALHVHIGMPDGATAARVLTGLREYLPVLIALSANSPWWSGRDAHLASARYAMVRPYPTRRVPDPVGSYEQYADAVARLCADAGLADGTFVYWDLRIHPRYGTVEVREMDAACAPETSVALAALIQALAAAIADGTLRPDVTGQDSLSWACFRAARDGLGGPGGAVAARCAELLRVVRPVSVALGSADALDGVQRILRDGNGATAQRRAASSGGAPELLRHLVRASNPAGASRS